MAVELVNREINALAAAAAEAVGLFISDTIA
jgi:hypothetical protein